MQRILIIEDDKTIAEAISANLQSWGYECHIASDFGNILQCFNAFDPHLVLLDISLPFFNGYHWCAEIRKTSKVPIIFVSSASDNMNIVMAMNMGGDDFIAKPFDLSVLTVKVQALLRRAYEFTEGTPALSHRGASLFAADASLRIGNDKIELTKNEYRILQVLLENKGRIVTRDALMTRLWETDSYVDENTLTVNITRLRRKLDACSLENFITTKRGMGYVIE